MKRHLYLYLSLLVIACSQGNQKHEDVTSVDTAGVITEAQGTEKTPTVFNAEALEQSLADMDQNKDNFVEGLYEISLVANGYEYMSSSTWYLDSVLNLLYYETTWAQEGMEGKGNYFLNDEGIICCTEQEDAGGAYSTTVEACHGTGGRKLEWATDAEEATSDTLPPDYLSAKYEEILGYYKNVLTLIKSEEGTVTGDDVKILLEKAIDVGEEYTETTEILIPKELYEKLK